MSSIEETLTVAGRKVRVSNPDKVFFPASGVTKLDLVRSCLAVAPGVPAGCRDRPTLLKRHRNGVEAGKEREPTRVAPSRARKRGAR